jgi:hypothetical protein
MIPTPAAQAGPVDRPPGAPHRPIDPSRGRKEKEKSGEVKEFTDGQPQLTNYPGIYRGPGHCSKKSVQDLPVPFD